MICGLPADLFAKACRRKVTPIGRLNWIDKAPNWSRSLQDETSSLSLNPGRKKARGAWLNRTMAAPISRLQQALEMIP
jgi:hypothetical protein